MANDDMPHVEVAVYVLGGLRADEAAAFEGHLVECAACQVDLEAFRGLPALLDQAAAAQPPRGLRARTLRAVRRAAGGDATAPADRDP